MALSEGNGVFYKIIRFFETLCDPKSYIIAYVPL
ncbi:hypothetical protein CP488_00429 [Chthonomonas calidirosea]|nr:hypothetical protein CP488_00429 [Chthonomonas calidirosea]